MDSTYSIIAANDKESLRQHQGAILKLFALCFGHEMDPELWEWAYQRNPCGDAYVQLAYKDKELVGHYAMIPQYYCDNHQKLTMTLSMTTMVHPAHRRAGLFNKLAEECYALATENDVQAVLGFPNSKSAPGFRKRLQWQCNDDFHIVKTRVTAQDTVPACEIIPSSEFRQRFQALNGHLMLDLGQEELLNWRLSKPGADYSLLGDEQGALFIVKPYADTLDLIFSSIAEPTEELHAFAQKQGHTALVSFTSNDDTDGSNELETTQYRFGYRPFQKADFNFLPQLIMSDVF
jgi:Acetyltransferase (GNAT) domain